MSGVVPMMGTPFFSRSRASDKTSKLNAAYERIQRARGQH